MPRDCESPGYDQRPSEYASVGRSVWEPSSSAPPEGPVAAGTVLTAQVSAVLSTGASVRSVSARDVWVPDATLEEAGKPKAAMPCSERDSVFEHRCCGWSLECVVGWWKPAGELLSTVWIVNDSAGTVNDSALSHGVG